MTVFKFNNQLDLVAKNKKKSRYESRNNALNQGQDKTEEKQKHSYGGYKLNCDLNWNRLVGMVYTYKYKYP